MTVETPTTDVPAMLYARLVVDGEDYCIPIAQVRENRRWSPTTRLPHSPPYMLGSMNLRGEVIPIIDLAALLGFSPIKPTDRNVIVIVEEGEKLLGLAVEAVRRILSAGADQIRETPGARRDVTASLVSGLVTTDEGMVRIVDLDAIVAAMEGAP